MLVPETEIIISKGGAVLARKTVRPGEYVIGCEANCEVLVEVELVSRRHAQLTVNYDHVLIEDLGSSNGTFVNGQPVSAPTRLWPNQKIQIGAATIEVRRTKTLPPTDASLDPSAAAVQRLLPEALLRERKYDIGGVIAEGGMGAILDAREAATDRVVAMKVMLRQSNSQSVLRFIEEAQVTAQLEHPNIVPVHELGVDASEQVFYTMKFVRGVTLREVLDRLANGHAPTVEKYPLPALLTIFQKVCDALAFAHSRGVIHRDLKPANIMLGDFGEVLVMDWGLAKRQNRKSEAGRGSGVESAEGENVSLFVTQAGAVLGTPQYMAPEQAQGDVESLDARTDIYALGAILYQLLALRPSVAGKSVREIVDKVGRGEIEDMELRGQAPRPHLPGGRIPVSLAAVTRQAMALSPSARYQTVAALQAELTAYQSGFATSAENASAWKQLTLLVRRHRIVATVAGASLVLLTGISGFYTLNVVHARDSAKRALVQEAAERQRADEARAEAEAARTSAEEAKTRAEAARAQATADRTRADQKAAEAEAQRTRATEALAELRKSAPAFFELAQNLRQEQQFEEALAKLSSAIQLEPEKPGYLLVQAHLFQATEQLAEAAKVYQKILALPAASSDRDSAARNLAICEEILRANRGQEVLTTANRGKLFAALLSQGRSGDAVLLDKKTEGTRKLARVEIMSRLSELVKEEGFRWEKRLSQLPSKSFRLDLSGLQISQVPNLTGLAITELILDGNQVLISLDSLKGSRLEKLSANRTPISDLNALAGLPLTHLSLYNTGITSLTPLRGLALKQLDISATAVSDLSPLQGMPLEVLNIETTNVRDLRVVSKLPLRALALRNLRFAVDLGPIAECRTLESLAIPKTGADLLGIRSLPNLRVLVDTGLSSPLKPGEYWQRRPPNGLETTRIDAACAALVTTGGLLARKPQPAWNADGLLELDLRGFAVTDLQPLRGLPIAVLNLQGLPVTDFSPLAATPVKKLILGGRFPADLPPVDFQTLKKVTTLTHLTIENSAFRSLENLAGLRLKTLQIPQTDVSDLSLLRGSEIEDLSFPGTQVSDIQPLLEMRALRTAEISENVTNAYLLDSLPNLIYGPKDNTPKSPARKNRKTR